MNLSNYSVGILSPEQIVVKKWIEDKGTYMYRINGEYISSNYVEGEFYLLIKDNHNNIHRINIPILTDTTSVDEGYFYAGDIQNNTNVENMVRNRYVIKDSSSINVLNQHGDKILQVSVYWEDVRKLSRIKRESSSEPIRSSFVIFTREGVLK